MKLFGWRWLVVSSLMSWALAANGRDAAAIRRRAARCHAGRADVARSGDLDPATLSCEECEPDSFARRSLTMLMFDTLVDHGRERPSAASLATVVAGLAGQSALAVSHRRGVKFHDGTPLTAEIAAASLRAANPSWNVSADADSVVIEAKC